jgi:hypothetical protein
MNDRKKLRFEESRVYKEEKGLNDRKKVVFVQKTVHMKTERKAVYSKVTDDVERNVLYARKLNVEQKKFLEDLLEEANTNNGSKFLPDFIRELEESFDLKFSVSQMSKLVHGLGYEYVKMESGYYKKGEEDLKNVKRREEIVPILNYIHTFGGKVVVWNYDECPCYVKDFSKYGWARKDDTGARKKNHIMVKQQKGERINVSAFVSQRFGILYDNELDMCVGDLNKDLNDTSSCHENFRWFSRVVKRQFPDYLHIATTDSPKIHTAFLEGYCNPNNINVNHGGVNRGRDNIFESQGFKTIFGSDPELIDIDTTGFKVADFKRKLWGHSRVKAQRFALEEILAEHGHLLLFHPVAHPCFAPIELFWRDMKYDYRVNYPHTKKNLYDCIEMWLKKLSVQENGNLSEEAEQHVQRYFRMALGHVRYYLSGGKTKIMDRKLKRLMADNFDELENSSALRKENMQSLYQNLPMLPKSTEYRKKLDIPVDRLREILAPHLHERNWKRMKHGDIA